MTRIALSNYDCNYNESEEFLTPRLFKQVFQLCVGFAVGLRTAKRAPRRARNNVW